MFSTERFGAALRRARRAPRRLLAAELAYRFRRAAVSPLLRLRDAVSSTYARDRPRAGLEAFAPRLDPRQMAGFVPDLAERCARYLEQRFDLLGSGWRTVAHGTRCPGYDGRRYEAPPIRPDAAGVWLEGEVSRRNLAPARAVWRLLGAGYRPVDWHLDFRSGYRWSPLTWYRAVPYGHLPGVDVKVPWELARMQHLPQMALAFGCAREGLPGFLPACAYRDGFRNQVLDFVATNPPRYGVNWHSTMEVAIRVANWLLAYDLLGACGAEWDTCFEGVFVRSVREHGRHIAANLERSPVWRNNHYLGNLTGLIFAAAYLAPSRETAVWGRIAAAGLAGEIEHQFLPDGGHFEASTSYHAFAAEMAAYAVAMVFAKRRRDGPPAGAVPPAAAMPAELTHAIGGALGRMGEFLVHMTKPGGRLAQIGDHDSGRLFKLQPRPRIRPDAESGRVLDEEHLDARNAVAAINGLLGRADLARSCGGRRLDELLVAGLVGETPWQAVEGPPDAPRTRRAAGSLGAEFEALCRSLRAAPAAECLRVVLVAPGASLLEGLQAWAYPDFGAYVLRSNRLFLCLRAGGGPHERARGHAHADQLALEVCIDGVDWIQDPGSYVYTADPDRRNRYRSSRAHFVPYILEGEPGLWRGGLFDLALDVHVREVAIGAAAIGVDLLLEGTRIGQTVTVREQEIEVGTRLIDGSRTGRRRVRGRLGHAGRYVFRGEALAGDVAFSPGYGLRDGAGA